jgi:hypothetical protein
MNLSARFLSNVGSVNVFSYEPVVEFVEGDAIDVYFQLIDTTQNRAEDGFKPSGRRFMPSAGATLTAVIDNIDNAKQITRPCSNPFSNDISIWKLSILNSDVVKGTANLKLTLVDGSKTYRALVKGAIRVSPNSNV